jgi:hypothetical protein
LSGHAVCLKASSRFSHSLIRAFKTTAGTGIVTDILFLRKRAPREKRGDDAWVNTGPLSVGNCGAPGQSVEPCRFPGLL